MLINDHRTISYSEYVKMDIITCFALYFLAQLRQRHFPSEHSRLCLGQHKVPHSQSFARPKVTIPCVGLSFLNSETGGALQVSQIPM